MCIVLAVVGRRRGGCPVFAAVCIRAVAFRHGCFRDVRFGPV